MGQIKVVIDTNVVISAILFGGVPGKLVGLWKSKAIVPFISKEIMDEYVRVLAYPKFELSDQEIHFIIYKEILPYFEVVTSDPSKPFISSDPSDDKFIQCAICGNAAYIISGDDHLLSLKPIAGIKIVNPLNFIAIYFL